MVSGAGWFSLSGVVDAVECIRDGGREGCGWECGGTGEVDGGGRCGTWKT